MEFIAGCRHPSPLALELLTLCLGADERWFWSDVNRGFCQEDAREPIDRYDRRIRDNSLLLSHW